MFSQHHWRHGPDPFSLSNSSGSKAGAKSCLYQRDAFETKMTEKNTEFEARINKQDEEFAASKKIQEEIVHQADAKLKKVTDELEAVVRKSRVDAERLQSQLERLAIDEKQRALSREKKENEEKDRERDRNWAVWKSQIKLQRSLLQTADAANLVRAKISTELNHLSRLCNVCLHMCSAQLSFGTHHSPGL